MGFFACLPGIWRLLQCLRRYRDTKNKFPHLANAGKYTCTILYYVTLSVWRIRTNATTTALFIICAGINGIYVTIWDIGMDWSLGNPKSSNRLLRNNLGIKSKWPYYLVVLIDPIIRANWIFYVIFAKSSQHSALLSFLVSLSETFRRALWAVFRMENEHCANVDKFKALKDIRLPFKMVSFAEPEESESALVDSRLGTNQASYVAAAENLKQEQGHTTGSVHSEIGSGSPDQPRRQTMRQRRTGGADASPVTPLLRTLDAVGYAMSQAHTQDFQRKKQSDEAVDASPITRLSGGRRTNDSSDEESDDDEDEDEAPVEDETMAGQV
jgi:hypothetical protein